jgi:DNA-directed RNA polymerase specialized sigma24 family protein/ribosome-associated translation inhibitor RaiA
MNVHISYKVQKTPDIEKEINHLVEKLRKRLQVFRPELVHLKGVIEQNSPREGAIVSLNLRLPSGQMAVQESASNAATAIKAAFDDLLQQLTKHKDLLRSSHKWPRWRRGADTRPTTRVAFEDTVASVQAPTVSSDDVRSYVNANLKRLERFVERELYFRETAEQLLPDFVNKEEVIDEVIARALGDGGEKPERLALEPWLYRLAIRSIDDLSSSHQESLSSVPLEESVRKRNVRASDEAELQFHQPDETFTEETVIPDRRTATPEDIAYSDEMVTLVQYALDGTSRADREVFILHAIEGFSVDEIVAITDRKPSEIISSIVATREHLRRSPPLADRAKNKLQKTGTDYA